MKIFDLHVDLSGFCLATGRSDLTQLGRVGNGFSPDQVDLPRLKKGKVKAILGSICPIIASSGGFKLPKDDLTELFKHLTFYYQLNRDLKGFSLANYQDKAENEDILVFLSLEGAYFAKTESDLKLLTTLRELGIISIAPTWNLNNNLGTGAGEIDSLKGLTQLGGLFIEKCEEEKIVIDAVHTSRNTFWDIIKISKKPILVSHTASAEVFNHERNLTKDQIRAVAEKGGLIGLCFINDFLGQPSIEAAVEHLKSLVNIAGLNHVAIGSDFAGMWKEDLVKGIEHIGLLPHFFRACQRVGFSQHQLDKIAWENAKNLFMSFEY